MSQQTTVVPVEMPTGLLERMGKALIYYRKAMPDGSVPTISELVVMSIEESLSVLDEGLMRQEFVRMTCRICHSRHQIPRLFATMSAPDYVCQWCETTTIGIP